jgi:predicted transcriptional regulator
MPTVTKPCRECGTLVEVLDDRETGAEMRSLRQRMGLSGERVAKAWLPKTVTRAYISLLETGEARWTHATIAKYRAALARAAAEQQRGK